MRLRGYDYTHPGYYFITICTYKMRMMFGIVEKGSMSLNSFGYEAKRCWLDLPNHYSCQIDACIVMPNHIHGIIIIPDRCDNIVSTTNVPAGLNPLVRGEMRSVQQYTNPLVHEEVNQQHSVSEIVRGFKTFSAAAVNKQRGSPGARLWMRSFHDHIIRSVDDIERVREYIRLNPSKWNKDSKNLG